MCKKSLVACVALLAGCGGTSTDPGDGSRNLEVEGEIEIDQSGADIEIKVERFGDDVETAEVWVDTDLGDMRVPHDKDEKYKTSQAGHARWYHVEVEVHDDWLDGRTRAPERPELVEPDPTSPIEPRRAEEGVIHVQWSGELADQVRIKTDEFEWEGQDQGEIAIPATSFEDEEDEIEIRRRNQTPLAGGAGSSHLEATAETETDIAVIDPYDD